MSAKKRERNRERTQARARGRQPVRARPALGSRAGLLLRGHWKLVLATIVLLHVIIAVLALFPAPHTGGDNAAYRALAQSLLERHEYREIYNPTAPIHTQYPPGFPIILALASLVGITTWVKIKLLIIAFSATAVAFSYLYIRRHGRPELATGVALLLALAPGVIEQSHWELSDVPFWAMTMIAVWAWQRLPNELRGRFIIAVVATTFAYFTRSAGLPLMIAAFGWLALHKRWKQLAVFGAVILPLAFLWWLRAKQQGGVDYVGQFWFINPYEPSAGRIGVTDLFARMKDNGGRYLTRHLPVLLFGREGLVPLGILIIGLGVYGWAVRVRDVMRAGVGEFFLPLYIGLILVWPSVWSGERFLLPALPFILFYAGDGFVRLLRMISRDAARAIPAATAALLAIIGIPALAGQIEVGRSCMASYKEGDQHACLPEPFKDFYRLAAVAPRVLPEGAAVLSRKDRSFYIMGGVPSRPFPLSPEPDAFFAEARASGARYVVYDGIDALAQKYVAPVLLTKSNAFCILFSLGQDRATLFGIDPAAGALPASAQPGDGSFAPCSDEYWKNTAVKDSLMKGLIPLE